MDLKTKTTAGTICAFYIRDDEGGTSGVKIGLYGKAPVATLEYSKAQQGLVLTIDHKALDESGIALAEEPDNSDRFAAMLADYINSDAEAADLDYVRERIDQIGLSREDAENIGLGWIFES